MINFDEHEKIAFYGLDCGTKNSEIVSNPVATAIISHYLLTNSGDKIAFIDDTHFDFSLFSKVYPAEYFKYFEDKTNAMIDDNKNNVIRDITLIKP